MEKIPKEKKYFRIIIWSLASKKADQFFLQKIFGEAHSNFSTYQFLSPNGKANSQANQAYHYHAKAKPIGQ